MRCCTTGPEAERQALRNEVIQNAAWADPGATASCRYLAGRGEPYGGGVRRAREACKEYIASGDIYQIVLSVLFRGKTDVPPFEVYRALRLLNPSPYMFFFDFDDLQVVGSSPEALVKLNGKTASLRPIAGTLPRGATTAEDLANEEALLADPKEAAEHVMLVDLARNDLGRVASAGIVRVDPYRAIERYSHVMHIVSGVQGELAAEFDQFDLFAASFPAGTLVGAPKVRAMQIIEEMEQVGRGLYAGTAGYFGLSGDMDQAITIRTLVFSGDEYSFQAGAGIVADSVPAKEYQEVLAKSAILRRALEIAGEGCNATEIRARAHAADRQLRLVHLQPRAGVRGAGCRRHGLSQRRDHGRRGARARADAPGDLPGPGRPEDAGVSLDMIAAFAGKLPILGVCLGHQSIVQQQGGEIVRAERLMHGKTSMVKHDGKSIFEGFHSRSRWAAITRSVPNTIRCRTRSMSRPRRIAARSWACGTRPCRSKACSFTRKAC